MLRSFAIVHLRYFSIMSKFVISSTADDWMDLDLVDFQAVVPSLPSGFGIVGDLPELPVTLDEIWDSTSR